MNTNALDKHSEQAGSLFSVRGFTSHSITEVVYHHRLVTCFNELHHTVAPDVASSTCDQHLLCHSQNLAGTTQTHRESTPHSVFWWSYLIPVGKLWIPIATEADPRSRRALEKQDILQSELHWAHLKLQLTDAWPAHTLSHVSKWT